MLLAKSTCSGQCTWTSKWNCIAFLVGAFSVLLEFMFLYVPSVGHPNSIYMDWHSGVCLATLISVVDFIFLFGIILKSCTTFDCDKCCRFRKELQYSNSSFVIDLLAILPLPQLLVGFKMETLVWWVMIQILFKIIAMSPTPQRTMKMMGVLMKNAWLGALQNLFYFIAISNGLGALFYDSYMFTLRECRRVVNEKDTDAATLDWDGLIKRCTETYNYEYGIFTDAFTTKIGTRSFMQKCTYCLAWGLKSLSSFGQIFSASSYSADTFLSFVVIIFGLILFGDLLAKMQTALQCTEVKEDKQRTRQRMVEEWMKYHQLPQPLKKKVTQAIQSDWSATRGINDETMLDSLPCDTRSDIRRHLYLEIIHNMPLFEKMDEDLINAICGYLRTFSSNKGAYVAFQGEPVRQLLFIFSGQLEVSNANNVGQCMIIGPGDLCGKELLEWCSHPTISIENIMPATQTIKCITDVDAFALRVDDVKLLAIQFHRNGKFRHAFLQYAA